MLTGIANLPLHNGNAPPWLFKRMRKLATGIAEIIIEEYGEAKFLEMLSNPYWFQSLGCVAGFDWHSSGLTTTLTGALRDINKLGLNIKMAGGKGLAHKVQSQIEKGADELNLSNKQIEKLKYSSKMSAKVDSVLLQDGFSLYHHTIFFTKKSWVVVQQGKDDSYARRYHLISDKIKRFTIEPNNAISSEIIKNNVLDLTNKNNLNFQKQSLDLINDNPKHIYKYFKLKKFLKGNQTSLSEYFNQSNQPLNNLAYNPKDNLHNTSSINSTSNNSITSNLNVSEEYVQFTMPKRHYLTSFEISNRVKESLQKAYEYQPQTYEELISLKGIGKKAIRALTLVSEIIYGTPILWKDPAKYSFAHGGKDGIPYPVDKSLYDQTNEYLKSAINELKIDNKTKIFALKRLSKISINK